MDIKKLFAIEMEEDLIDLGFKYVGQLIKERGYENFYEKLYMWENKEKEISILVADTGNDHCSLIAIKPLKEVWPTIYSNQFRGTLNSGLHFLIEDKEKAFWDFNIWEPDENHPSEYGALFSSGQVKKEEYPTLYDALYSLRKVYEFHVIRP